MLCFSRMPERNHAAPRRSQPAHAAERKLCRPRRTHPPNPLGRRRPLANLVSAQFSHDAAGRLAQIRHQKPTAAPWPNTATSATPRPAGPRHGKNRRPGRELNREQKLAIRRCRHGARPRASGLHGHEGTSQPHALIRYGDPAGRQVPRGVLGSMMGRK